MTKDEEQLIANIMYRMHANEQARLDAALSSARADAVTRAEQDRKRIEGLCVQAQDQREEIIRLNEAHGKTMVERDALREQLDNAKRSALDAVLVLDVEEGESPNAAVRRIVKERDGMRAEVAEMRKHCDALRAEVAQLKSQTPKEHPVKAGEWVTITIPTIWNQPGDVAKVLLSCQVLGGHVEYQVRQLDGSVSKWRSDYCQPCDPPTEATHDTPAGKEVAGSVIRNDRKTEPKPGDVVRLVRVPTDNEYQDWDADFGIAGSLGLVTSVAFTCVIVKYDGYTWEWPLSCVEVVRTEPDEIKVGDVVEVFQKSGTFTLLADVGKQGDVLKINRERDGVVTVTLRQYDDDCFDLRDVRKVTT